MKFIKIIKIKMLFLSKHLFYKMKINNKIQRNLLIDHNQNLFLKGPKIPPGCPSNLPLKLMRPFTDE